MPVGAASTGTLALYDSLLGETLEGRYRVEGRLGEGGLAVVYSGVHLLIEKPVALKVLKVDFLGDTSIVQRFLREAKAASKLAHRNIVSISDFGNTPQGAPFFVMERLAGPTLGDLLSGGAALPLGRALAIAEGIGAGLAEAHRHGIVHRDLKPDNVLLVTGENGEETVKIVDFGLAQVSDVAQRLTRSGQVLGTPEHMAPEQVAGKPVDSRADLFALGILLYRMLSGRLPFTGRSAVETLSRLLDASPEPLPPRSVDGFPLDTVGRVVFRALARDPSERPASAQELVQALRDAARLSSMDQVPELAGSTPRIVPIESLTQETRITSELLGRERLRKVRWRRQLLVLFVAALAVLAGVLLGSRLISGSTPGVIQVESTRQSRSPVIIIEQSVEMPDTMKRRLDERPWDHQGLHEE
ncbi:MAG: serine/threonine-protein kinase [Polyangia bacterium]|nr:serine/threonine-protein kinase [Polyangia bacterium]